jgi:MFS family permease
VTNAPEASGLPRSERPSFRTLMTHYGLYQLAGAIAGGFIGAYLLRRGLSLPATLCVYAAYLLARFLLRFLTLAVVRRIGPRRTLALGMSVAALQYVALFFAYRPLGLISWIGLASLADSLYWPTYHATAAMTGGGASRGREVGLRTAVGSVVGVVGPLSGGFLLARYGIVVDFSVGAVLCLAAALPALCLRGVDVGPIPTIRDSLRDIDFSGVKAFAADGWLSSGLLIAWPLLLYQALGSRWQSFGVAGALAGLSGAVAGMLCGGAIDRGDRNRWLNVVSWALAGSILLRAASFRFPLAAEIANATGAAVFGLYVPVLMTGVYERAKSTGAAYRFHFAAEAGWDVGGSFGCFAAALAAWATKTPSLSVLPSALAILALWVTVRGHAAHGSGGTHDSAASGEPASPREVSWPEAPPV